VFTNLLDKLNDQEEWSQLIDLLDDKDFNSVMKGEQNGPWNLWGL
jgi:hypothetical protein